MQRNATILTLGLAAALPLLGEELPERKTQPMRDVATHGQLSQSLRMAQQNDPVRNIGPAIGQVEEDPFKHYEGRDLVKDSIILCYRGSLTLLPKRSVLHLPDALKSRFEAVTNAAVVTWPDFYKVNRGWIRTVEVTRDQAMGAAPLDDEMLTAFETSASVVVATFKGGPISVKPYIAPEIAPTETQAAVGAGTSEASATPSTNQPNR